jgi:hypothetical protein
MFRIRDILIQIQIQILGSSYWIRDPDTYLYVSGFQVASSKCNGSGTLLFWFLNIKVFLFFC